MYIIKKYDIIKKFFYLKSEFFSLNLKKVFNFTMFIFIILILLVKKG